MRSRLLFFCAAALLATAFPFWSQKPSRKADIEFSNVRSTRQEGKILFQGRLKVAGEKAVTGLILKFALFASQGEPLTVQEVEIEEGTLPPGQERDFTAECNDSVRAVRYTIAATTAKERFLRVLGGGPYPLD